MYLIVFIHEFGHIVFAKIFKWNIVKVNIYPFGGCTLFSTSFNKKPFEEFLVFIGGILFQFIFFIICKNIYNINSYTYELICQYNFVIMLFNLLPINPLDGGKLFSIILNLMLPVKLSLRVSIYFSYLVILFVIIIFSNNLNFVLIMLSVLFILIKEHGEYKFVFNKFLLERYLHSYNYNCDHIIKGENYDKMMKYRNNKFLVNSLIINESDMLKKLYKN